jgi:hypothetical protein
MFGQLCVVEDPDEPELPGASDALQLDKQLAERVQLRRARGNEPNSNAWFNPVRHRLYAAIGKPGLVDVIDSRSVAPIEKLPTAEGAYTTVFDRLRQRLYVFQPRAVVPRCTTRPSEDATSRRLACEPR